MFAILRQRNFALLWSGGLISLLGNWMLFVALPFHIYMLTGSALATGVMFMVQTLPGLLFGSLAGVFADRWDRRRIMIISNLINALVLLPLLFVHSAEWVWLIYAVAFVEASVSYFFAPAENALLPRLVGDEQLAAANALNQLNNNIALVVGPVLGGLLATRVGLNAVVLIDSFSYLLAALLIWLVALPSAAAQGAIGIDLPELSVQNTETGWATLWREWRAGLHLVQGNPTVVILFIAASVALLGEGITNALLVPFVHQVLGGDSLEFSWLVTARGIGGILGGLVAAHLHRLFQPLQLFPIAVISLGMLEVVMFNTPMLQVVLIFWALIGVPAMVASVSVQTIFQRSVVDEFRGRIFGAFGTTVALATLSGQGLGSALGDRLGVLFMLNLGAGFWLVAGGLFLYFRSAATKTTTPPPAVPP